jgi:hypothetical protein
VSPSADELAERQRQAIVFATRDLRQRRLHGRHGTIDATAGVSMVTAYSRSGRKDALVTRMYTPRVSFKSEVPTTTDEAG